MPPELSAEDEALVKGWASYTAAGDEADFKALDELSQVTRRDLERGWRLVLALVDRVPDKDLPAVGTGPLENLIGDFPVEVSDRVAAQASEDPRFRTALEWVYLSRSTTPPAVREKLVLATNGRIRILS